MPRQSRGSSAEHEGGGKNNAESEGLRTGFRRKPDSVPMIADSR
jgi:hypothetical protein